MNNLNNISHIYFIGIGGIGMSALARYFHAAGKQVAGYDKTASTITEGLTDLGIEISFQDSIESITSVYKSKEHTLVVYTPAVPKIHSAYQYYLAEGFRLKNAQKFWAG